MFPWGTSSGPWTLNTHEPYSKSIRAWSASAIAVVRPGPHNASPCTTAANAICATSENGHPLRGFNIGWHYWCISQSATWGESSLSHVKLIQTTAGQGMWTSQIFQATYYTCNEASGIWFCWIWGAWRCNSGYGLVEQYRVASIGRRVCK